MEIYNKVLGYLTVCSNIDIPSDRRGGEIFFVNKISESKKSDGKKSLYPEVIFKHPFREAAVIDSRLYDSFIAFEKEYRLSNIHIFAINEGSTEEMAESIYGLKKWFRLRLECPEICPVLSGEEKELLERIADRLRLTASMKNSIYGLTEKKKVWEGKFPDFNALSLEPPSSPSERREIYGKLKEYLME